MGSIDEACLSEVSHILAEGKWIQIINRRYIPESLNRFRSEDVMALLSEGVQNGLLFKPVSCSTSGEVYMATRETLAALGMNMNPLGYAKT